MLARRYFDQQRLDEARAEFEGMAERDPSNVTARTMVGILLAEEAKRVLAAISQ